MLALKNRGAAFRVTLAASVALLSATALSAVFPAAPALAADSVSINGGQTFQTMAGFGASEAFGEAATVMNSSSSVQQQTLNDLYSPTSGAGLTILRNEIGSTSGNTIEPNNPGGPNATPNYVSLASINQDMGQLWFAQQIKQDFGVTNVFADAWSAPAYMKTNGSVDNGGQVCGVSGTSCGSGDWRQAYANYLLQYAKDYASAGVPLSYIGPSNEPDFSASYDSMTMSGTQMASLLDKVGPTIVNSGLPTKVECCAATGWPVSGQYASAIESDPTALADTAALTSHGYSGAPTSPMSGWTKPAWETEWSTFESWNGAWDDGSDASGMAWAQNIYRGLTGANLSAFLYWWGSTTTSENGDNEGLVMINGSNVETSGRLWAFANYSRYIRPGAVRIGASSSNSGVETSAFKNPDGSVAVVAVNTLSSSDTINYSTSSIGGTSGTVTPYLTNGSNNVAQQSNISLSGGTFSATIPARSVVTYVIKPSGTGNTVSVTNPGSQTTTVNTPASLQIHASDSASGQTLTYSATGLPAGLSINSSTGLISGTPTTVGSSTVTVTAKDTTNASGTATFNWTVSNTPPTSPPPTSPPPTSPPPTSPPPTSPPPGTCHVSYTTASEWGGGFVANVTINNTGTATINNWTLKFTFPGDQKITNAWNTTYTQSGEAVTLTNVSYDGTITPGGNVQVGFQGTWTSNDTAPSSFTLNGTACT